MASTPATGLDVDRYLREVCDDLATVLGAPAAVAVVLDPFAVDGSTDAAVVLGEAQRAPASGRWRTPCVRGARWSFPL